MAGLHFSFLRIIDEKVELAHEIVGKRHVDRHLELIDHN